MTRGVLLDFARFLGVEIRKGDSVLLRMGFDARYRDRDYFLSMPLPGPDPATARALVAKGIVSTGSDTMPYEAAPGDEPLLVHAELIPKGGVFIFEMLDLRELTAANATEFLFVALPLNIEGGTGSPINPVAILP